MNLRENGTIFIFAIKDIMNNQLQLPMSIFQNLIRSKLRHFRILSTLYSKIMVLSDLPRKSLVMIHLMDNYMIPELHLEMVHSLRIQTNSENPSLINYLNLLMIRMKELILTLKLLKQDLVVRTLIRLLIRN